MYRALNIIRRQCGNHLNSENSVRNKFLSGFSDILKSSLKFPINLKGFPTLKNRFEDALRYNVLDGKLLRAILVYETAKSLSSDFNCEVEENSIRLGWCVEMLQTYFLMIDDVEDESITRRDKLCWYRLEEIGLSGINDAMMIDISIYRVLKHFFSHKDYYITLHEKFQETSFITAIGQSIDLTLSKMGKNVVSDFSLFNMNSYNELVRCKTSHYSYFFPFSLGLLISGNPLEGELFNKSLPILNKIGNLFQAQDDYIDVYGDSKVSGKIGTDIKDGKCTWLCVKFLEIVNQNDLREFKKLYGSDNSEAVESVKRFFHSYKLSEIFLEYQEKSISEIKENIYAVDLPILLKETLSNVVAKMNRRKK